jgi:hypothetical protein
MAITKALVFSNVTLQTTTGGSPTTYENHVVDTVEVTVTPVTDTIRNGQTLAASFDVSLAVGVLNTLILEDSRVYRDTTQTPTLARIVFNGATGSRTLNIGNVILNGMKDYSGNRDVAMITATIRTTNVATVIIES